MAASSKPARWQALLLAGFVVACCVFLALRFWPRNYIQDVLGVLPDDSAIQMYVDVPAAVTASSTVEIPLPLSLGVSAGGLEAMGFALAGDDLYLSAGGRLGPALVESALSRQGVACAVSIAKAPCVADLGHGVVSIAMAGNGVVLGSTEPLTGSLTVRAVNVARPRAALSSGAIAWAEINPALLDAAMENPPENWINLQLIARALEPARVAYATLSPTTDGALSLAIEAHCDAADSDQLVRILGGLNDMAKALISSDSERQKRWGPVLSSFNSSAEAGIVRINWLLEREHLAVLWSSSD